VHRETSPLLYSSNRFGFTDLRPTSRLSTKNAALDSFLTQTGHQNAGFLRHICIDFPAPDGSPRNGVQDDIKTLELIRDNCTGIAILETSLSRLWPLEYYKGTALELLDARFKTIPSLKEVIVHVHAGDEPIGSILKKMDSYGWTTKMMELEGLEDDEYICFDDYVGIWDDYEPHRDNGSYRVPLDQW